jgi:DNA primase
VPDSVAELILCGDGDSERVLTALACARAAARHARPGRVIRMLMAPDGKDWNDVLREGTTGDA